MQFNYLEFLTYFTLLKYNFKNDININTLYNLIIQEEAKEIYLFKKFSSHKNISFIVLRSKPRYINWFKIQIRTQKLLVAQKNKSLFIFQIATHRINKLMYKIYLDMKHQAFHELVNKNMYNSLKYYQFLLDFNTVLPKKDSIDRAIFCYNIGIIYKNSQEYDKALKYYYKAIKIKQEIIGFEDIDVADTYNNIGIIKRELGEYNFALQYYKKSLNIKEKLLGCKHSETLNTYNNIALIYNDIGKYTFAFKYYEKIISNIQSSRYKHIYLNNIGVFYSDLGEYDKALHYHKQALEIRIDLFGYKDTNTASSYNNLGIVYNGLKKYKKAFKYYKKAFKIRKESLPNKSLELASSYNNLGIICTNLNKFEKALKYHEKALSIRQVLLGKKHNDIAISYNNIATVHRSLQHYSTAIKYNCNSIRIQRHKMNFYSSIFYENIGLNYLSNEKFKNAYQSLKRALTIRIKIFDKIFQNFNSNTTKKNINKNKYNTINIFLRTTSKYLKILSNSKKRIILNEVYNIWLNNQIDFQDNEAFLSIISNSTTDSHLKEQIELLKIKKYYLAKLLNNTSTQNEERIIKTQNEISDIEIYLAKNINKFKESQNLKNIDASMIYKDLSADSVFIDCIYGEKNIYIFIIHHNGNIDFIEIDKKDSSLISKYILEFRENIDNTASAVKSKENPITKELFQNKKDEIENILHEIYQVLFQKYIIHHIKGIKRLIISPDGLLHQLSFEALYDGNNYLLHTFDIIYIASGREFIRLNKFNKLSSTDNNTISAFANPNYDNTIELKERDGKNNNFRAIKKFEKCHPLPKTKTEVLAIKNIFPSIKVFTELNANEENLQSISNSKILHIATHGIVVENKDEREPLLKCALALTGYNTSIANKNDYGIFTGLKIVSLNLKNTDLVVLSTCESAKGQSDSTEGVASLSRAFMMAGANATIASLWEANDEYSKDFFTHYYKKLSTSSNYNKAFKETQLESFNNLQNKGLDHPLFWACFCFFGTGE